VLGESDDGKVDGECDGGVVGVSLRKDKDGTEDGKSMKAYLETVLGESDHGFTGVGDRVVAAIVGVLDGFSENTGDPETKKAGRLEGRSNGETEGETVGVTVGVIVGETVGVTVDETGGWVEMNSIATRIFLNAAE
jgi:hypothetical protein